MAIRTGSMTALVVATTLLAACGNGETTITVNQSEQAGISVTGSGSVTVVPDIALLSIGAEVTRDTVAKARSGVAEAMEAVRGTLAHHDIEERDITTSSFNIRPQYSSQKRETLEITGYTVSNHLNVKLREMDDVPTVLDDAIASGGNAVRVHSVSFIVDEPEQYLAEARQNAMEDARTRAEHMAELAKVKLGKVRSISESNIAMPFSDRRSLSGMAAAEAAPATLISPGETEISLMVFVTYDLE